MATAIVPIIAAFEPVIANLIASLVHKHAQVAEADGGAGTGLAKFADVFVGVMGELAKVKAAGGIDAIPSDALVKTIIQSVVKSMQLSGVLGTPPDPAAPAPAPASSQNIVLHAGQAITITVA